MKKKVLITGVTGGIGSALLKTFVENGYFVIGQYNKNTEAVRLLKEIYSGETAEFISCDFSDINNINTFSGNIISKFGSINCLINNAGISLSGVLQDVCDDDLKKLIQINLTAPICLTRNLLPSMISEKKGAIINISSIWGVYGGSCEVVYSATKGGLISFTKALSKEVGLSGIRVNCLSCGFIDTPMTACYDEETRKEFSSCLSLDRIGSAQEVAEAALFLASDKASYITGQILGVDGGY